MTGRITEEGMRKRAQVVAMRRRRMTFDQIAETVGVSPTRAQQLYHSALAEIPAADVEEHRAEEQVLIDDATSDLMTIAKDPTVSPRTRIEAWNSIRGWAERKAALLGLDAKGKVEVISIDQIDREIARLCAELTERGEAVPAPTAS